VKLNHTTGSKNNSTVKSAFGGIHGSKGILKRIQEFRRNKRIVGYFDSLLIQPLIKHNTENKSICFNGECFGANAPRKHGSQGRSFFPPTPIHESFNIYAEQVVSNFRQSCPFLIADQLLRADYYCEDPDDCEIFPSYLLNEVEGYEAQNVCPNFDHVQARILNHWVQDINNSVKCHLRRINHPLSKFIHENKDFDIVVFKIRE